MFVVLKTVDVTALDDGRLDRAYPMPEMSRGVGRYQNARCRELDPLRILNTLCGCQSPAPG